MATTKQKTAKRKSHQVLLYLDSPDVIYSFVCRQFLDSPGPGSTHFVILEHTTSCHMVTMCPEQSQQAVKRLYLRKKFFSITHCSSPSSIKNKGKQRQRTECFLNFRFQLTTIHAAILKLPLCAKCYGKEVG